MMMQKSIPPRPIIPKIHQVSADNFRKWMVEIDGRDARGSAYHYSREIIDISKHYLEKVGSPIDIYDLVDMRTVRNLANIYNRKGRYRDFVRIRHYASTISKYIQYAEYCLINPGKYAEFHSRRFRY